jgi:hypothetical protein
MKLHGRILPRRQLADIGLAAAIVPGEASVQGATDFASGAKGVAGVNKSGAGTMMRRRRNMVGE